MPANNAGARNSRVAGLPVQPIFPNTRPTLDRLPAAFVVARPYVTRALAIGCHQTVTGES